MILLAGVSGVLIGMIDISLGHRIWPIFAGLAAMVLVLGWLGNHWLLGPFRRLLEVVQKATAEESSGRLDELPLARRDEIGRLARLLHKVRMDAVRGHQEAKRLRRTLDRRVEEATRQATRQLRQMAMRDPLTDVGNRRFFEENLPRLVESAIASGTDLVCLAIDMDNFKKVNDTLGHAAGDELLIFLASLVDASTRQEDYVARLGGDEFMVLLPGADIERAADLARQIIALFRQHVRTALPDELEASLSIGIASLNSSKAASGTELVEAADRNLYKAKNQGKGCAVADAA